MRANCENPYHEGDRLVERRDLVERRIEWRDLTTQGRFATRIAFRECKPCARIELLELTPEAPEPEPML